MALQPYVPPGSASATSIINYAGREISEEEREKRIKDVCNSPSLAQVLLPLTRLLQAPH